MERGKILVRPQDILLYCGVSMTLEQQKDTERLDRYIIREGLASVMNQTKWCEAIKTMSEVSGYPRFRVKCVRDREPSPERWEGSFPHHVPYPYKVIEWLEVDYTEELSEAFGKASIPFIRIGDVIRIQGYTRPSQPAI